MLLDASSRGAKLAKLLLELGCGLLKPFWIVGRGSRGEELLCSVGGRGGVGVDAFAGDWASHQLVLIRSWPPCKPLVS